MDSAPSTFGMDGDREHGTEGSGHRGSDVLRAPTPRTDGYAPLRAYAAIGDGRTLALVADDGRIDWFPVPELDGPPTFCALLDEASGGRIELAPTDPFQVRREYVVGTNVLLTTFVTATGVVRVTDALNTGVAGRLPWTELARRVDGLRGSVRMSWRVVPGTALGTASPWLRSTPRGHLLTVAGASLVLRHLGDMSVHADEHQLAGVFTTDPGSRHLVAFAGSAGEPVPVPDPGDIDDGVDRTIANWLVWTQEFHYDGAHAKAVQRSVLALKLLLYAPTGAIAAAGTTSLPESLAGGKNWDYRYAWVRDAAYTVDALVRFGLREETHAAISWVLTTLREGPLRVLYRLDGSEPAEGRDADAPGWREIGPVVDGNRAAHQVQLGVYGDVLGVVRTYVDA